MGDYAILLTTFDDEEKAQTLARAALEARLAACAQLTPVRSLYVWRETLCDAREFQLQLKIRAADYAELAAFIRARHDYETPEIVMIAIDDGDPGYLSWLEQATQRAQRQNFI
jgi:periplasmic divalent cation tolerance protein